MAEPDDPEDVVEKPPAPVETVTSTMAVSRYAPGATFPIVNVPSGCVRLDPRGPSIAGPADINLVGCIISAPAATRTGS